MGETEGFRTNNIIFTTHTSTAQVAYYMPKVGALEKLAGDAKMHKATSLDPVT